MVWRASHSRCCKKCKMRGHFRNSNSAAAGCMIEYIRYVTNWIFAIKWWMPQDLSSSHIVPFLTSWCWVTAAERNLKHKPVEDSCRDISAKSSLLAMKHWQLLIPWVFLMFWMWVFAFIDCIKQLPPCYWSHCCPREQEQEMSTKTEEMLPLE